MRKLVKGTGLLSIAAIAVISFGCATGESVVSPRFSEVRPDRVAVVDITGDIRGDLAKNQVEDYLSMEMMRKGYGIVERSRVQSVLDEQDFQVSDRTTQAEAAEIGRIMNIPAVLLLDVSVSGERLTLTSRMIDSESAEVLWIGSGRGGTGRILSTLGGAAAGTALGTQVGGGRGRDIATVGGGVLGGAAGYTLAPQTQRIVHRAIKQMVDDMPQR